MNRFVSVGLVVAVAPAILLAYGKLTRSSDTIEVASAALLWMALPFGALLIAAGLLIEMGKRIRSRRVAPAPPPTPPAKSVVEAAPRAVAQPLPRKRSSGSWLSTQSIKRIAYWTCLALVVLPMAYQACGRPLFDIPTESESLFNFAMSLEHALLLLNGGLVSPYFFGFYLRGWVTVLLASGGMALIIRRIWIALRARSLAPPLSYRGASALLSGCALGFWLFHALAEFGVPPFSYFALVIGFLTRSGDYAVGLLMAWFWFTELRSLSVAWPRAKGQKQTPDLG